MGQNQVILVTGSNSGFGLLITRSLLNEGHRVFAAMRGVDQKNADAADRIRAEAAQTKGEVHVLDMDVTSDASVQTAVQHALEAQGHIDVVVNNAGYGVGGLCESVTEAQLLNQLDVNVMGVHRLTRAVLPSMHKHGKGLIINISSIMGRIVIPFAGAYTASKFALEGLSESYRYELAGTGVDVAIIEPGGFSTNFMTNMDQGADSDRLTHYGSLSEVANQMWTGFAEHMRAEDGPNPQDVADAVVLLINTPAGQRPLRIVVDPMTGGDNTKAVNAAAHQIQTQLLEELGIAQHILPKS